MSSKSDNMMTKIDSLSGDEGPETFNDLMENTVEQLKKKVAEKENSEKRIE